MHLHGSSIDKRLIAVSKDSPSTIMKFYFKYCGRSLVISHDTLWLEGGEQLEIFFDVFDAVLFNSKRRQLKWKGFTRCILVKTCYCFLFLIWKENITRPAPYLYSTTFKKKNPDFTQFKLNVLNNPKRKFTESLIERICRFVKILLNRLILVPFNMINWFSEVVQCYR